MVPLTTTPGLKTEFITLRPGTRSTPVANSTAHAFAYVLSGPEGNGKCWLHGEIYTVDRNDCVGFKAGSGVTWAFINEAESDRPLEVLVFIEDRDDDEVYYPEDSPNYVSYQYTIHFDGLN